MKHHPSEIAHQEKTINRSFAILTGVIFFVVAFAFMTYLQFNPDNPHLSEFDSYYHIQMAELIRDQGNAPQEFPWLYYTILRDNYVDHQLLFHIILIPFVSVLGPIMGGKIFEVLIVALAFLMLYGVLKEMKVKGAFWWSVFTLFTMSSDFYYRMNFIRDMGFSLFFMMLGIYIIVKQDPPDLVEQKNKEVTPRSKTWLQDLLQWQRLVPFIVCLALVLFYNLAFLIPYLLALYLLTSLTHTFLGWRSAWLFVLCFLYVWAYGGFMFLPIFVITYVVAQLMTGEKCDWQLVVGAVAGMLLGLALNPYFPHNLDFLEAQIFQTGLSAQQYTGGEWRPYDTWFWVQINYIPLIVFFAGIVIALMKQVRQNAKTIALFVFSLVFLVLVWKSKRFVEYSPFFLTLAGISLIKPFLDQKAEEWRQGTAFRKLENIFFGLLIILLIPLSLNFAKAEIERARNDTQTLFSLSALTKVHDYLLQNAQPGDIVFTDDWDVFPRYFFANTKTNYIVGLDPEFMNQYDGEPYPGQKGRLYQEFAQISSGNDPNNLERIKDNFKASWILVNTDHPEFYQNLRSQPQLFQEIMFAVNDPAVDRYPAALGDGYYLFKVL